MPVTLILQGGEVDLHESESFNKIRHRLNKAQKLKMDYENGAVAGTGEDGVKFEPYHILTFRTEAGEDEEGGRISVSLEKIVGILSDESKDVTTTPPQKQDKKKGNVKAQEEAADDEEEYDEDDEEYDEDDDEDEE